MRSSPEALAHQPQRWLKPAGVTAAGLAAAIVVIGLVGRGLASQHLHAEVRADSTPVVAVIAPRIGGGASGLALPGDIQANYDAVIHARVSGYLKKWYTDIGAQVKAGQVLADIDTPDLDQQLEQAKADMATAKANEQLAKTTADRWTALLAKDAVSKQETDQYQGEYAARAAQVKSAQANVDRLQALESFKRIVAPFDGVVTARNTDIGALIAAGNPSDPGLFTVADVHRLRVYVKVPQSYSAQVKPGDVATLTVPEYPGRTFQAKLVSTSDAVGAQSGALLVELQMDNADGALKPGDYTQVRFTLPALRDAVSLPASALLFGHDGMSVAVLGPDNRARLRLVKVQRDLGATVELAGSGLTASDRVIDNPPDSLVNDELVRPAAATASNQG